MKYRYLSHTSEAKFQTFGKTLADAFGNVVPALFNLLTDTTKIKPVIEKMIEVKSVKLESLLFDFVDRLVFLQDTEGFLPSKVENISIKKNKGYILKALLIGDNILKYEAHGHIKAPTYSDMFIRKGQKQFVIQMVVDI